MPRRNNGQNAADSAADATVPAVAAPVGSEPPDASALAPYLKRLASISASRERLGEHELEGLREVAATAAGRGTALTALVSEYLDSACRVWEDLPDTRRAEDHEGVTPVVSALLRAVADATVALTEGYETAHRAAIRGEEATRREFVDDLLEGRTSLGRLAERAERFGFRLLGPHTVAVARATSAFGAGDPATCYVEDALTTRFAAREVLTTAKDGLVVCVSRGTRPDVPEAFATAVGNAVGDQHQIAISRPRRGPGGIVRSYQEARSTLALATQLGLSASLVHAADVLVFQVLGRDRAAITDLVATVLGGLEQARGGPQPLLNTLTAYFASGCLNTATARRLGMSVRTVAYRLSRIRQLTGHDPTDPDQRYILQTAALGARLLDWPSQPLQPAD
ncbi:regulator protein [Streptomyces sp. SA15]|uniref:PucR family transcriptional regulator n=1 Tax=Streptomyces sp. SA15 TaxID=934019 RepID=UPI000BB025DC|nr:helix-turn-helix domain-containing protein [Streptomyces sp. SA15]PAZ17156.1 regulator protein [Streptomyces sp. SA15]